MKPLNYWLAAPMFLFGLFFVLSIQAASFLVYTDGISSPWTNASYGGTFEVLNSEKPYSGSNSIKGTLNPWGAVSFAWWSGTQSVVDYNNLSFYIYSDTAFSVRIFLQTLNGSYVGPNQSVAGGQWTSISIPLSNFVLNGVDLVSAGDSINRINIQNDGTARVFYVDDVGFTSNAVSGGAGGGGGTASDSLSPSVSISSPLSSTTVSGLQTISASASDNVGVVGVQFKVDGVNVGAEDTSSPYSVPWDTATVSNGTHSISAVARDAAGNNANSGDVYLTVGNTDSISPIISTTLPSGGSVLSGLQTISASASDNVGVVGVQFKVDGVNVGAEDTSSPYSVPWDTATVSNGTHSISAVARDAAGNNANSNIVDIIVSNSGSTGGLGESSMWVSAYLPSWEIRVPGTSANWGSFSSASDIDWEAFTHLIFFAAGVNADGTCCTVQPVNYNWSDTRLKYIVSEAHARSKPILFSVGGAGNSVFATVLNNPTLRSTLITSLVNFMDTYKFDGVDIDIEPMDAAAAAALPAFSQELRTALDLRQAYYDVSKKPILTAAVYNFESAWGSVDQYYDQINIMSYDLFGTWWGRVWHNNAAENVKNSDGSCSSVDYRVGLSSCMNTIESKITQFLSGGIAPEKLGGGISFGSWLWRGGLNQAGTNGLLNPREQWQTAPTQWRIVNGSGALQQGSVETAYYDLVRIFFPRLPASAFKYDSLSRVPYISWDNPGTSDDWYVTYQDATSTRLAVQQIKNRNIGGMILWHLGEGYLSSYHFPSSQYPNLIRDELLQAVKSEVSSGSSNFQSPVDTTGPSVTVDFPSNASVVSSTLNISVSASDNIGVAGVQILLDGADFGVEDFTAPYTFYWNTASSSNGMHVLTARARDLAGNVSVSLAISITINNPSVIAEPSTSPITSLNPNWGNGQSGGSSSSTPTGSIYIFSTTTPQIRSSLELPTTAISSQLLTGKAFSSSFSRGSSGVAVSALQEFLAQDKNIYPQGIISGVFGPLTEQAVKNFQCKYKIACSGSPQTTGWGLVGPKTLLKLNELTGSSASASIGNPSVTDPITASPVVVPDNTPVPIVNKSNFSESYIRSIQKFLYAYPDSKNTGILDGLTIKAIENFQCRQNIVCGGSLETTGWGNLGPKTRARLEFLMR